MNAPTTATLSDLIFEKMEPVRRSLQTYKDANTGELRNRSFNSPTSFGLMLKNVPATDLDCAKLVRNAFGNTITYVATGASKGEWYYWDGTVHVRDETNQVDDAIAQVIAEILQEVKELSDKHAVKGSLTDDDLKKVNGMMKDYISFGRIAKGASGLRNIKDRIRHEFTVAKDYFDHDTDYIVLADGLVLDSRNIDATPMAPDAKRAVTNKMDVTFGGVDSRPGLWVDFLNRLGLAADDQKYLQMMAGAALVGRADTKNIAALVGVSNTGKTSYAMSVFKAFGSYAGNLPAGAIVDKGSVNFDQYKARGKRFILLEEPYEKRTDDSFLKNLSGAGGMVSTQEKGKNGVEWKPQGVLHITANHVPKIDTKDDAIVKRMNIVGFNIKGEKIVDEAGLEPADIHMRDCSNEIFEWILEGAKEYNETRRVPLSEAINKAAQVNVANGSVVVRWLLEQCEWANDTTPPRWVMHATTVHSAMIEASKDEYFNFNMWCMNNNEKVVSKAVWQTEINRFMNEPDDKVGKRPGGSLRLWGVSERDNKKANEALGLQNTSAVIAQNSPNHKVFAQR